MLEKLNNLASVLSLLLLVSVSAGVVQAADVSVTPPAGGGFVVKNAAGTQERFKVQDGGAVLVPALPNAASKNTVLCFDSVTGQLGPCSVGVGLNTGAISGTVALCGLSVTRTLVYIPGRSSSAYTGASGNFLLDQVPTGTHDLVVEAPGNRTAAVSAVVVSASQTTATGTTNPIDFTSDKNFCGSCTNACTGTRICVAGACVAGSSCATDSDCGSGQYCTGGLCTALGAPGAACTSSSTCLSNSCVAGSCQ